MTGDWLSPPALERLAGALLHFVWQGAAIGILASLALRVMSASLSSSRATASRRPALVDRGADPNARNSAGDTPLTLAIPGADASIAVSLIDRGADVNLAGRPSIPGGLGIPGGFGQERTPLLLAVQAKHIDLVRALLAKGADPNTPRVPTPLTAAAGNAEIVKLLTDAGAKP